MADREEDQTEKNTKFCTNGCRLREGRKLCNSSLNATLSLFIDSLKKKGGVSIQTREKSSDAYATILDYGLRGHASAVALLEAALSLLRNETRHLAINLTQT